MRLRRGRWAEGEVRTEFPKGSKAETYFDANTGAYGFRIKNANRHTLFTRSGYANRGAARKAARRALGNDKAKVIGKPKNAKKEKGKEKEAT